VSIPPAELGGPGWTRIACRCPCPKGDVDVPVDCARLAPTPWVATWTNVPAAPCLDGQTEILVGTVLDPPWQWESSGGAAGPIDCGVNPGIGDPFNEGCRIQLRCDGGRLYGVVVGGMSEGCQYRNDRPAITGLPGYGDPNLRLRVLSASYTPFVLVVRLTLTSDLGGGQPPDVQCPPDGTPWPLYPATFTADLVITEAP
jgi:hypothetical protein